MAKILLRLVHPSPHAIRNNLLSIVIIKAKNVNA
ncbi:unnamed protein product [Acanthoscelides obtectus]|uniref:Uncharacterized protein n=1 Tax=Acanthoscelides obtectus TaxID=200917 RepID=A0A9P0MAP9_ACAOB|nr:unnamed protein product [Acanthoscelides obtectus]CAK1655248.1 hypothetical protein AOBTE_LOCUS19106 [Acanthoscelides obtectus]